MLKDVKKNIFEKVQEVKKSTILLYPVTALGID